MRACRAPELSASTGAPSRHSVASPPKSRNRCAFSGTRPAGPQPVGGEQRPEPLAQLDAPVLAGPFAALDRARELEGQRDRLTEDGEPRGVLGDAFAGVLAMWKHSVEDCHYPRQHERA